MKKVEHRGGKADRFHGQTDGFHGQIEGGARGGGKADRLGLDTPLEEDGFRLRAQCIHLAVRK